MIIELLIVSFLPSLSQSLVLEAIFRGRFQYLTGGICSGPPPVLLCKCATGSSIEVLETSHATINCTEVGDETAECINTCTGDECSEIWADSDSPIDGVFGNITFACRGESVDAQFVYEDSGDGACSIGGFDRRNFHLAQLGISCSDNDDFVFDGNSFECTSGEALDAGGLISTRQPDGIYTCGSGVSCSDCTVDFDPVIIDVDEHRLRKECITSLDGEPIPDLSAPDPSPYPPGEFEVDFQADWATAFVAKRGPCDVLDAAGPTVTLKCENGSIQLIETLFDTVECTADGDDNLICSEPAGESYLSSISNPQYTGAIYVSS